MRKHHARQTFEPKYLSDYRVLCQFNEHTTNIRSWGIKTNTGDVKPFTTADLIESVWNSFLLSVCNKPTKLNKNTLQSEA